jgi:subfamily B ATP-binding cassette protein MsbA
MTKLTLTNMVIEFVKENPYVLYMYVVSLILLPLNDILMPIATGNIIKKIGNFKNAQEILKPFVVIIAIIIVLQLGIFFTDYMEVSIFPRMCTFFRRKMIYYIVDLNETKYNEQESGSIIANLVKLPGTFFVLIEIIRIYIVPLTIVFCIAVAYFFTIDTQLAIALLIVVVAVLAMVYAAPNVCLGYSSKRDNVLNAMHTEIDDILHNLISIYNSGQMQAEDVRLMEFQNKFEQLHKNSFTCAMHFKTFIIFLQLCFFSFFMYRSYHLVVIKKLDNAKFVSMFLIALYLNGSMLRMSSQLKDLVNKMGVIDESMMKVFGRDIVKASCKGKGNNMIETNNNNTIVPNSNSIIKFVDVSLTYDGTTTRAVNRVSFEVVQGECVMLKGKNGTGKSSILKLIMKYNLPDEPNELNDLDDLNVKANDLNDKENKIGMGMDMDMGDIYFKGIPYCTLTPTFIRQNIGFVPQTSVLFNRSIYDNIVYGTSEPHKSRLEVERWLVELGLQTIFGKFPNGIDGVVGKNGSFLSGGQRQIVTVLRVILQDPAIILMDEPTAAIDVETKQIVQQLLTHLVDMKRTIIMVSHDEFLEKFASRVIHIE